MKKLMFLSFVLTTIPVVAAEADLERLNHLNDWQWTKDHELCDALLNTNQVDKLSPGAMGIYARQLKAAVEGYDAWESERQKHLAALTDEERKEYKAKREKAEAERKSKNIHQFEHDQRRAKEIAENLVLARQQLAAISARISTFEEPAIGELLKAKIARIDEINKWIWAPRMHLCNAVAAFKNLDATASSAQKELAKFNVMSALLDLDGETKEIDVILITMSAEDKAVYDSIVNERAEVQWVKDPHGFERNGKSLDEQAELIKEARAIIGL